MKANVVEVISTENYKAELEVRGGFPFIHIHVFNWNKSVLKEIRESLNEILVEFWSEGIDLLYFYNVGPEALKFTNLIRKPDHLIQQKHRTETVNTGAWETKEAAQWVLKLS